MRSDSIDCEIPTKYIDFSETVIANGALTEIYPSREPQHAILRGTDGQNNSEFRTNRV